MTLDPKARDAAIDAYHDTGSMDTAITAYLAALPPPTEISDADAFDVTVLSFADAVERLAFSIPPANSYTPQFVSLAIGMRTAVHRFREARRAVPPSTVAVGEVRALEWETLFDSGSWRAKKPFGSSYYIEQRDDLRFDWNGQLFDELADAKAAAQADYEARIRSALVPPPPQGEPVTEAVPKFVGAEREALLALSHHILDDSGRALTSEHGRTILAIMTRLDKRSPAALSAQPTAGWRTMDSAPKEPDKFGDCPRVMACAAEYQDAIYTVTWDAAKQRWEAQDGTTYHENAFSHWMPLPDQPPPANAGGKL